MNTFDRIIHPGHRRTDHNHRLVCIGHRTSGCSGHLIFFGCRCGNGRRPYGSHRHGAADRVIVVDHYPDFGRICACPYGSMYSSARSGEPEPSLCG